MTISTTFKNGTKDITATVTGSNRWEVEGKTRIYFELEFDKKREPIGKLYEVIEGGTRDNTVEHDGRVFGYDLIGCDSNVKRREAIAAVESLIEQIVSGEVA